MIVTCSSCQTRFRVPPEKIGPNGARIRCSRCQHVFAVAAGPAGALPVEKASAAAVPPRAAPPPLRPPPLPAGRAAQPAPPPAAPLADPFASPAGPPAGARDPFAPAPPAAPPPARDPFAPREDTFSIELATGTFGGVAASPAQRATPDLAQLLGAPAAPALPADPLALALEEREVRPPAAPRPELGFGELDLGLGPDDLAGPDLVPSREALGEIGAGFGITPTPAPLPAGVVPMAATPEPPAAEAAAAQAPARAPAARFPPPGAEPTGSGLAWLRPALSNSLSLLVLLAVAAGLLVAWRAGLAARLQGALVPAGPPLGVAGVTGGLYDTSVGAPALVVRGHVAARGAVAGPVRVHAALLEGGREVASAEGLAGATATPEEIFEAGAPEVAAALRRALDARAVPRLAAGAGAPFLVLIPPPAPSPRGLELRVTAEPARSPRRD